MERTGPPVRALLSEAVYLVGGIAMFLAFCVAFYLVWLFQTEVVLQLFGRL